MAMSRAALAIYLDTEFGRFRAAYRHGDRSPMTSADDVTGYGPVIDDTLLRLGVPYSQLVAASIADADVEKARAVARVYALRKFASFYGSATGTASDGAIAEKYNDLLKQVTDLLIVAEEHPAAMSAGLGKTVGSKRHKYRVDIYEGGR